MGALGFDDLGFKCFFFSPIRISEWNPSNQWFEPEPWKKPWLFRVYKDYKGCGTYISLGGGFKCFFFSPLLGEMIQFDEHVFQMGWFNHQLDDVF